MSREAAVVSGTGSVVFGPYAVDASRTTYVVEEGFSPGMYHVEARRKGTVAGRAGLFLHGDGVLDVSSLDLIDWSACSGLLDTAAAFAQVRGVRRVDSSIIAVTPDMERRLGTCFTRAGFRLLADMVYVQRSLPARDVRPGGALTFLSLAAADEEWFSTVLLEGLRDSLDRNINHDLPHTVALFRKSVAHDYPDRGAWLVALDEGIPVGTVGAHPLPRDEQTGIIQYLSVLPAYRRDPVKRYAQAILAHAVLTMSARGHRQAAAVVDRQNTPSLRLFQRFGFTTHLNAFVWTKPLGR